MNAYERVLSDMMIQALIVYFKINMIKNLKRYLDHLKEENNGGQS